MRPQARRKYNYQPIKSIQVDLESATSKPTKKRLFGVNNSNPGFSGYDVKHGFQRSQQRPVWRKRLLVSSIMMSTLMGGWYLNQSSASYAPLESPLHIFKVLDFSNFASFLDGFGEEEFKHSSIELELPPLDAQKAAKSAEHHALNLSYEAPTTSVNILPLPELDSPLLLDEVEDVHADTVEATQVPLLKGHAPPVPTMPNWLSVTVKSGDNLSSIFGSHGLSQTDLQKILSLGDSVKELRWLQPGQQLRIQRDSEGAIEHLVKKIDVARELHVTKSEDSDAGFVSEMHERDLELRHTHAMGKIESSLFSDGQNAGLNAQLMLQLVKIFGWDIDFALDIQPGDSFSVIYEELYLDDKKVKNGNILAAEFVNNGLVYQAVRYTDPSGHTAYYSPQGESMQKAFLRTPVKIGSISSHYSNNRKHPILNKIRAHKGVDYAAPIGTPIYATGSGRVIYKGRQGGYGRTIQIQHSDEYSTLYAHLSAYAKSLKKGQKVRQGDIIGYVGRSGLASGPHLHYEFHVDGRHKNPLTVKLPKALPLDAEYQKDFFAKTRNYVAQLNRLNNIVAQSAPGSAKPQQTATP
jgi:murein DD-endopeptidase MepM/ murein hydrolase activator NlpD